MLDDEREPGQASVSDTVGTGEPLSVTRAVSARGVHGSLSLASRYEQQRLLGEGAMGAVYLVRDRETGETLALKKLFRVDARTVLRLKREFRSLAHLSHPNLIRMHEIGQSDEGWYVTLEYVDGQDLDVHLGLRTDPGGKPRADAESIGTGAFIETKVLPAFHQLALGVHALHAAGMLHRDLKPSNVMVAGERVLVLDFGLVRELDDAAASLTEEGAINGTPAYMAPEQALSRPLTPACDWYAFGVMLYEAMVGERPFDGTLFELMRAKLEHDPAPAASLNPEVPERLNALCKALLTRDPAARPTGEQVLAALQPMATTLATQTEHVVQTETHTMGGSAFFGREPELALLYQALRDTEAGRPAVLHVRGVSGTGKSALVEQFLEQIEARQPSVGQSAPLVLRSRCYEREAMPFKALDGVIDALSRHLAGLDDVEVGNLLPGDVGTLAQVFPVLERLRAVQRLMAGRATGDAAYNRQRAEAALRELLRRLADRYLVVIWIDDLQWGDLDSAGILSHWFQQGTELPVLFVLSYRSDEATTSPCLQTLLSNQRAPRLLDVVALGPEDIAALCSRKLGRYADQGARLVRRIVQEAQGSPFLATQLTALAEAKLLQGPVDEETISVAQLVAQTATLLSREALVLLRVLALAGRPVAPKLALRAAGIRHGGRELVHTLRGLQLVRSRDVGDERLLEPYHDRVREAVQRVLSAEESAKLHASLLSALEFSGSADADWLHFHAAGAGEHEAALRHGLTAAERALTQLAFERAAELFARCVELSETGTPQRCELLQKRAIALDHCGRGSQAADVYLEAAQLADREQSVHLFRLATSHLLASGRFAEGEALLSRLLEVLGHRIPTSDLGLVVAILWERVKLALRGLHYVRREATEVSPDVLARIDTFDALYLTTVSIHPLRAALFMARSVRWALDAGEPSRVLNALGQLWYYAAMSGSARTAQRVGALRDRARQLAEELATPAARARVCLTHAAASFMLSEFSNVLEASREADQLYRQDLTTQRDARYQMRLSAAAVRIGALYSLGEFQAFERELRSTLAEARANEDTAAQLLFTLNETMLDELHGGGEAAIGRLEQQRPQLPQNAFGIYHGIHLVAVCTAACASGRLSWGLELLEQDWAAFQRSAVRHTPAISALALQARARLLINVWVTARDSHAMHLKRAKQAVRDMRYATSTRGFYPRMAARMELALGKREPASKRLQSAHATPLTQWERELWRYLMTYVHETQDSAAERRRVEDELRAKGVDAQAYLKSHYPELFRGK